MARPRKAANDKLTEFFAFRQTVDARARVERQASLAGMNLHDYVRNVIEGFEVKALPSTSRAEKVDASKVLMALNKISLEQARVGNNVNQLAAAVHQGRGFSEYWKEIGQELEQLNDLIQDTLTTVGIAYDRTNS